MKGGNLQTFLEKAPDEIASMRPPFMKGGNCESVTR